MSDDVKKNSNGLSGKQLLDLQLKLEINEREIEKEIIKNSRPVVFAGKTIKWDGLINFFKNFTNRVLWYFYGDDVAMSKRKEKK